MSAHGTASAVYPYAPHPTSIHSEHRRLKERAAWLNGPPQLQVHPPCLLLHPVLHLARIDELPPPAPAVIVSPHSLSPPRSRDSAPPATHKASAKTGPAPHTTTDGKQSTHRSVPTSTSTMTSNGVPNHTGSKRADAVPSALQRPPFVSQHSNSVPSTPMQSARKYESHSRSPSPNGGLGSHSPRSVSSEANSTMPSLRLGRPFKCQYETNVGNLGRRRVPYHSSDILDPAKEVPKKTLDPHEDGKLSGDMRELYGRIQPNQAHVQVRDRFVNKVQHILETEFPGHDSKVHVFGSSGNMLWTSESDVDICIQTPMKRLEEMHALAEALDKHGMQKVVCIPGAKVRIVKVWDPELDINCDINVNNVAALDNTRMIKTYIQIDDRVRPLAMIIKHWTKKRILNDAGIGGTISSYTWICMIINFLQTRNPPILPALHNLPHREIDKATGKPSLSSFADDLDKLRGFGEKNNESLGQLLFEFFRLYGHEVDFEKEAISVRQGKRLKREEKNWHPGGGQKEGVNRLCVEEPFNIERNLGNSADDYAWRGIHLEIRRAFDLLADGQQLEKACEQFEFPAEEKPSAIFKKPQSQKATITSSVPIRSGPRGGASPHRGGRGGFNSKGSNNNGRRSSNGTSFAQGRPPFLHSPPLPGAGQQEYFAFPRGLHEQLHDQLFQQYQMLEMQSNSLRAQLAAQQHQQAHQARAAQMHAHAIAQAQAQNRGPNSTNGSPQKSPFINGHSSPRLGEFGIPNAIPQGFLYHHPGFYNPLQSDPAMSQDGSRTNPSSPSLSNSVPGVRRNVNRVSNTSDTGSVRSQSQPPRGLNQQAVPAGYSPMPQLYDASMFAGYPIVRSTQDNTVVQSTPVVQRSPPSNQPEPAILPDTSTPKEYVGYYVADQTPATRPLSDYAVSVIPSFSELAQRRRRVSPEVLQPLLNTAIRRASRSPSPLSDHMRNYPTVTNTSAGLNGERKARVDSVRPAVDAGPVIVNGSFPAQPREVYAQSNIVESSLPEMPNAAALGIYTNSQNIQQIRELEARQQLVLEEMQRQRVMEAMGPSIVNGSMKGSPLGENNGLTRVPSEEQQPFSTTPEGWTSYDSNKSHRNNNAEDVSPKRVLPPQWRTAGYTNGLPSLDIANTPRAPPQEIKSANLPLLSPVFETRTPSPTLNRSSELSKLVNGTKVHTKENHHARRASHTPAASNGNRDNRTTQVKNHPQVNEKSNKPHSGSSNGSSPWQSQGGNKRRKGGKGKKAHEQKTTGEPLPVNVADRKGG
ncbi:hypothetical protein P153DRAFT_323182 [Dothidotthia symphoricarpi CBS 119687]|uniref:polynucleotide adenylyltransferase n=1 Tax=Dothidotthia symphoricarpi CBS 119687 TaxID=1392245 RepID=A0A6A6A4S4_9PLEO|nr:uncharacterized protein P153DRAFT_323182 [Dothidotthia symphoricarpi CBS 119687]KAF2126124.1 hypothetical protein P153DRAFT_323182 [Dothidotthia symphoricarpi CBS 119687]